jgi:hypothetical protein
MASYWAELDTENIVTQVITGVDDATIDGIPTGEWYSIFLGKACVETWIDRNDKTYAGISYIYSYDTQDFTAPYIESSVE